MSMDIQGLVTASLACMIGLHLLDGINWALSPKTPYYLRRRVKYLETKLIAQTCIVNEEIIRP